MSMKGDFMIMTQRYRDILVFLLAIFSHKTTMTCQQCDSSMCLVFEDDIKFVMSPRFNEFGLIVDYLGRYPEPARLGVEESGYFEIQCANHCQNKFDPERYFSVVNRIEDIHLIRSGVRNDRAPGQVSLFDDFI